MMGEGPSEPGESLNWFQAITLLKAVGHSHEDVLEMGPKEFRGYLRAAIWMRNKSLAEHLHLSTLAASAGFSGSDTVIEKITEVTEQLNTAHNNV